MTPEETLLRIAALQRRFINFDTDVKRLWKRASVSPDGYIGTPVGAFDGQYVVGSPPGCEDLPDCTTSGCDGCVSLSFGGVVYDICMTQFAGGGYEGLSNGELVRQGSFSHNGTDYAVRLQNPGYYWVENTDGTLRGCGTIPAHGCSHPSLPPVAQVTVNSGYTLTISEPSRFLGHSAVYELPSGSPDPITSNVTQCFNLLQTSSDLIYSVSTGVNYRDGL